MRSIRLSLVVYFLVLLAAALGAVSWLVYQLAAGALDERFRASQELVRAQFTAHAAEVNSGFDRRLIRQAHYVAAMARTSVHAEAAYPSGLIGLASTPRPDLHLWLWLKEGFAPRGPRPLGETPSLAEHLFHMRSMTVNIEAAEDLMASDAKQETNVGTSENSGTFIPPDHAHEYFQAFYRSNGPVSRSHSLITATYTLPVNPTLLKSLVERQPHERFHFDTLASGPNGRTVRYVTLLSSVRLAYRPMDLSPWAWDTVPAKRPGPKGPGFGKNGPPGPGPFRGREIPVFVQYAIDTAPTDARLQQYADERDQQLARLEEDTLGQLQTVQHKLWWIALATFAASLAGGYVLLRLGLAPIGRLSDALTEVSERDFRLNVDPQRLPSELQPIAEHLAQTLAQLGRAFEREKQAAADISHELRTPLAALLTTVEVALRKARSAQEYREILEECRSSGRQMSHMVERLLALARLDAGAERARPRAVDAAELALQCADLVRPLASAAGVTLSAHVEAPLPVVIDPDKLREVVTNLLHNAVQYNRPGGTIELAVDRADGGLCIDVRDTGIGIALEARQRIFERFYRADPSRHADAPHAGLGLAIVKSYVDLLGGSIAVDSEPGVGTRFRIRLPVPEAVADSSALVA